MAEQAPACGDVPVVIHEADQRNQPPGPEQADQQPDCDHPAPPQHQQGGQECDDKRQAATAWRGQGVRTARIGDVQQAARQRVTPKPCGQG
ncbi:hypothetical protein D3C73_1125750 [compost metagenome]